VCRIAGFWDQRPQTKYDRRAVLESMRDRLSYGGPDAAGAYFDERTPLAFGHRRLSILDLSEAGTQPLHADDHCILLNGEVYNFEEVRRDLMALGHQFRTGTDTEVVLKGFLAWGEAAVDRFRGMFAFAVWDKNAQKLTLCRDRIGVKPLYWYWKDGLFLFASELKALLQHPDFDKTLDQEAVSLFLQQGYIPAPRSIYRHVHKLMPGSFLALDAQGQPKEHRYWRPDYEKAVAEGRRFEGMSDGAVADELENLLAESFQLRMVADVPVGMFLSGGIDSSLVTALLQKQSARPLKTFTIGFRDPRFDEAGHARAVARHLGTEHHELYCTEEDFKKLVPELSEWYDEPFGDSSGIPTYLVSRMAREHVTVSLSADGGDELFGGYTKYEIAQRFYPKIQRLPTPLRKALGALAGGVDPLWLERNAARLPVVKGYRGVSNKFDKFRQALAADDLLDFFNRSSVYLPEEQARQLTTHFVPRYRTDLRPAPGHLLAYLGVADIQTYLEGDIMAKVDRATMQVALEGREPFLDHRVVEYALSLPDRFKIRDGRTKYILRQILYRHVPQALIERPKQGFAIPMGDWLRGMLRPDLEALANDRGFLETFELDGSFVRRSVSDFLSEKRFVNPHFMWFLYALHAWKKTYL
jgi:asparagine synthase (glutamine-hydrolysing)